MPQAAYQTRQTRFLYGGASFVADLLPSMAGPATFTAECNVLTVPVPSTAERVGARVLGDSARFTLSMPCRVTDETAKVVANRGGIVVIHEVDAAYGYAFSAISASLNVASPTRGILGVVLTFAQDDDAVSGVPVTTGSYTVGTGQIAYVVGASSIILATTGGSVPTDGFAIVGTPITGEGV